MSSNRSSIKPPTPPSSNGGDLLQNGFQHLIDHNAATSFHQSEYSFDGSSGQMISTGPSSFGSSGPTYQDDGYDGYQYGDRGSPFSYGGQPQNVGLGISYNGEPYGIKRETAYGPVVDDQNLYEYGTPAGSPTSIPTPGSDVRRMRSGQIINRPLQHLKPSTKQSYRPIRSPKPTKKIKKEKVKAEHKVARLEKPLSELTRDWTHVPVVDIAAYVNRPAEQRRREVEEGKQPGKVKRPMNSFMLYRKAYQNRTKNWCLQNNHQVVSQVCGDSWPLEPESVREQFNEWARIERQNHQNAHPGYKFSPSKAGTAKASKRKASVATDETSNLEDFDWRNDRGGRPVKQQKLTPRPAPIPPRNFTGNPYYVMSDADSRGSSLEPGMGGAYNNSAYSTSNPGRRPPAQYDQSGIHQGQYWQQQIRRNQQNPNVEDVLMRRAAAPGADADSSLGYHNEFPNDSFDAHFYGPRDTVEIKIDPSLMAHPQPAYDNAYAANTSGIFLEDGGLLNDGRQWEQPTGNVDRDLQEEYPEYLGTQNGVEGLYIANQQLHILNSHDSWQVESLDAGDEFNKWMDGE